MILEDLYANKREQIRFNNDFCDKKSFYGKAKIEYFRGNYYLTSYDTNILGYKSDLCGKQVLFINSDFQNYLRNHDFKVSQTTLRHIKCFCNYLHSINPKISYEFLISKKPKKAKIGEYFEDLCDIDLTNGVFNYW